MLDPIWTQQTVSQAEKDSPERASCRATRCKKGEIAPYVLMPGDPGRAYYIAHEYLDEAKLVMVNREFHSYTGKYKGVDISVISTGLGSPGATMVAQDLPLLGVKAAIRVGTCGTPAEEVLAGDVIVATGAIRDEGSSKKFMPDIVPAIPDFDLTSDLHSCAKALSDRATYGLVLTSDGFKYPSLAEESEVFAKAGLKACEMECSAVFIMGMMSGVKTASILSVDGYTGNVSQGKLAPDSQARDRGLHNAIKASLEALVLQSEKSI